jgi:peroxiredoxin
MPSVQKAHESFQGTDVAVVAIAIDGAGERAIAPFMAEHGYTFPALYDPSMNIARQFGVRMVPTTYVVNREGVIVGAGFGPVDLTSPEFAQYLEAVRSAS